MTWPTHLDGRPKRLEELTPAEHDALMHEARDGEDKSARITRRIIEVETKIQRLKEALRKSQEIAALLKQARALPRTPFLDSAIRDGKQYIRDLTAGHPPRGMFEDLAIGRALREAIRSCSS